MNNFKLNIQVPIGNCPLTDLPKVAIFQSIQVHRNGYVKISYSEDTLDKKGDIFRPGNEIKDIVHHPQPINTPEGMIESETTPEIEQLLESLREKIAAIIGATVEIEPTNEE